MKHSNVPVYLREVDGWILLTANEPEYGTTLQYVYGELSAVAIDRFQSATEENRCKFRVTPDF